MFTANSEGKDRAVALLRTFDWKLLSNDVARAKCASQDKLEEALKLLDSFGWTKGEDYGAVYYHGELTAISILGVENIEMLKGLKINTGEVARHGSYRG